MTKAERTRMFIVEKTAPLFNARGYDGTSLSDLTEATGLTKGALYGHFANKDDMAVAAFRYSIQKVKIMARESMKGAVTYREQLISLLDFYARYVSNPPIRGGCPLLNTAVEADDHHISLRPVVARELVNTVNFIAHLLDSGVAAGEFKKKINSREIAFVIFCCVEGALMFSRAERSPEAMDLVVNHLKGIIEQISRRKYATKKGSRHWSGRADAAGKYRR